MNSKVSRTLVLGVTMLVLAGASSRIPADTGMCGGVTATLPFTDVAGNVFFCQIAEAFFSGLSNGTTATTYSPSDNVSRDQMAAFITRTQDSALKRLTRRATLDQWAMPAGLPLSGRTVVGALPALCASDGTDVWVADFQSGDVKRVRGSDGSILGTWTGATNAFGVLSARGVIYVSGDTSPGSLYVLDPARPPQAVTVLSTLLGSNPGAIATDGFVIWTANLFGGSVSRFDPESGSLNNITTGFSRPSGILTDGGYVWVTDAGDNTLKKIDPRNGDIFQSIPVGAAPQLPVFDGFNIWVPNRDGNSVTVVRVKDGLVLATLAGNGLNRPAQAAFDGERILVTSDTGTLSIWQAATLTRIGAFPTGQNTTPFGACSDGINFWITLQGPNRLARF